MTSPSHAFHFISGLPRSGAILDQRSREVMPLFYAFLVEPLFRHDYQHIRCDTPEYDEGLGRKGLGCLREPVGFEPRQTVLPQDLFEQYAKRSFWHDTAQSRSNVIRIRDNGGSPS